MSAFCIDFVFVDFIVFLNVGLCTVHSAGNVVSSSLEMYSPAASPDEEVIYIRGRRTPQDVLSSTFSEFDSDGLYVIFST